MKLLTAANRDAVKTHNEAPTRKISESFSCQLNIFMQKLTKATKVLFFIARICPLFSDKLTTTAHECLFFRRQLLNLPFLWVLKMDGVAAYSYFTVSVT